MASSCQQGVLFIFAPGESFSIGALRENNQIVDFLSGVYWFIIPVPGLSQWFGFRDFRFGLGLTKQLGHDFLGHRQ